MKKIFLALLVLSTITTNASVICNINGSDATVSTGGNGSISFEHESLKDCEMTVYSKEMDNTIIENTIQAYNQFYDLSKDEESQIRSKLKERTQNSIGGKYVTCKGVDYLLGIVVKGSDSLSFFTGGSAYMETEHITCSK